MTAISQKLSGENPQICTTSIFTVKALISAKIFHRFSTKYSVNNDIQALRIIL